jgi:acetyl-CoA synthetase
MTEPVLQAETATARLRARDLLREGRDDYETAYGEFRWPELETFNWALDWFDVLAAEIGAHTALWIVRGGWQRGATVIR